MKANVIISEGYNVIITLGSGINNNSDGYSVIKKTTNTNFIQNLSANSKLESIDFRCISGTPLVKVGTSINGNEYIPEKSIISGVDDNNFINQSYESAKSIYFTISGGELAITLTIKTNAL